MAKHEAATLQSGGVIRQRAHRETGQKAERSIECGNDSACGIGSHGIAWDGEFRNHPLCSRQSVRKNTIEELVQLGAQKNSRERNEKRSDRSCRWDSTRERRYGAGECRVCDGCGGREPAAWRRWSRPRRLSGRGRLPEAGRGKRPSPSPSSRALLGLAR